LFVFVLTRTHPIRIFCLCVCVLISFIFISLVSSSFYINGQKNQKESPSPDMWKESLRQRRRFLIKRPFLMMMMMAFAFRPLYLSLCVCRGCKAKKTLFFFFFFYFSAPPPPCVMQILQPPHSTPPISLPALRNSRLLGPK
jgi:hypothetical protein